MSEENKGTSLRVFKLGGHFPGSLVLLAYRRLLIADTFVTAPAALGDWSVGPEGVREGEKRKRPEGMNTYSFMWSIPNMIPLGPEEIAEMWTGLKWWKFVSTHGAFVGTEVRDGDGSTDKTVKERLLESMQMQVKHMGHKDHPFLQVKIPY